MDSRYLKHLLSSAATGSFLMLSASQSSAGRLFPDQPSRPHVSAACADNWGYNQTCWQRFPPIAPCDGGAGCGINPGMAFSGHEQSAAIYTPQSGLILPNQYSSPMPSSSFPQGSGGMRYSPAPSVESSHGDAGNLQLVLPSSPELQLSPGFSPSNSMMPQGTMPQGTPLPVPLPANALPPLPSPPTMVPAVPTQSSVLPNRLMFGPDGRIAAAPVQFRSTQTSSTRPVSTASRYGQPSNVMPSAAMPPAAILDMSTQVSGHSGVAGYTGAAGNGTNYRSSDVPVQFANRTSNSAPASQTTSRYGQPSQIAMPSTNPAMPMNQPGVPAQAVSQVRPISKASNGTRYGGGHSGSSQPETNQVPASGSLEPLRSTPRVPYQR